MKKILFVLPHMICGGVEKALLSLINELPKDEYDISVMVVKSEGDFVELVPEYVHYSEIPLDEKIRTSLMLGGIKSSVFHYAKNLQIASLIKIIHKIINKDPFATLLCDFEKIDCLQEEYDVAICFHIHMPFIVKFVAEKVRAKVKCAWIHNDFKMSGYDVEKIKDSLDAYDHYFAVSEQLLEEFIQIFPDYKKSTSIAHNIISEEYIRSCLNEKSISEYDKNTVNLLTIGRLDKQKGYDLAVKACKMLKDKKLDFNWYVLGNGVEEENIKKMINEYAVEDCFHLLGIRINPYPYIDNCDIYVQPSKHEGYGIAVAEARMLNKPIVCTDFTGARDQIMNGHTGTIVEVGADCIAKGIEELINNVTLRKLYSENLKSSNKSCENELKKIVTYFR